MLARRGALGRPQLCVRLPNRPGPSLACFELEPEFDPEATRDRLPGRCVQGFREEQSFGDLALKMAPPTPQHEPRGPLPAQGLLVLGYFEERGGPIALKVQP